MKIVLNKCYGGFRLSGKAMEMWAERKGYKDFYWYEYSRNSGYTMCEPPTIGGELLATRKIETPFKYENLSLEERDSFIWNHNIADDRTDPDLIAIVEELGDDAGGMMSKLRVVEIPDDIKYEIEKHDGMEWVGEEHRTWG